ncbi:MAG: hypothetical protein GKS06_13260 [Acidobacteria bacterium]|nr:hypothetical protein [Acidobacteriota bacterium]
MPFPTMRRLRVVGGFMLLLAAAFAAGCKDGASDGWAAGYESGQASGAAQGRRDGIREGTQQGERAGIEAAIRTAESGSKLSFYYQPVVRAAMAGAVVGLLVQILFVLHLRSGRGAPGALAVALLPGLRESPGYAADRDFRRRLAELRSRAHLREQEIGDARRAARVRLHARRELEVRRIECASELSELHGGRFAELADQEFARVIAGAAGGASAVEGSQPDKAPHDTSKFDIKEPT